MDGRVVAVGIAGLVVGWGIARGLGGRAPAPVVDHGLERGAPVVVEASPEVATLRDLVAALERCVARLEALPSGPSPAAIDTRVPIAIEPRLDPELAQRLDRLQEAIDALAARETDPARRMDRLRAAKPEVDWEALEPLVQRYRVDVEAARAEILLLSAEQLLERYGTPSLIWGEGNWVYGRNYLPERDAYALQVVFQVQDGQVRSLYLEGR